MGISAAVSELTDGETQLVRFPNATPSLTRRYHRTGCRLCPFERNIICHIT